MRRNNVGAGLVPAQGDHTVRAALAWLPGQANTGGTPVRDGKGRPYDEAL